MKKKLLLRAGARRIILWLPETDIHALVGEIIFIQEPINSSEKCILRL